MRDPNPENITGEKVRRHVFKHEINWGMVAIALAVIVAVWFGANALSGEESDEDGEGATPTL